MSTSEKKVTKFSQAQMNRTAHSQCRFLATKVVWMNSLVCELALQLWANSLSKGDEIMFKKTAYLMQSVYMDEIYSLHTKFSIVDGIIFRQ